MNVLCFFSRFPNPVQQKCTPGKMKNVLSPRSTPRLSLTRVFPYYLQFFCRFKCEPRLWRILKIWSNRLTPLVLFAFEKRAKQQSQSRDGSTDDSNANYSVGLKFLADELLEVLGLCVVRLRVQETVVVLSRLVVLPETVVAQCEVKQTLSSSRRVFLVDFCAIKSEINFRPK